MPHARSLFPQYAEVAINLGVDTIFHYHIPEDLQSLIQKGMQVIVPFRNKETIGYVTGFVATPEVSSVKSILKLRTEVPVLPDDLCKLAEWMHEYYLCPQGAIMAALFPAAVTRRKRKEQGNVSVEGVPTEPHEKPSVLTDAQAKAISHIIAAVQHRQHTIFLLHGVTGSGKTEVYLQSIEHVVMCGRSCIVLVPEIALTPQMEHRFRARFGNLVIMLHSGLLDSERARYWHRIGNQEVSVVIGVRSSVFAPVKNLGLIIVDEEHENTFKQDESPRYDAREVALKRAQLVGACVVLGSATPALESFYHAEKGDYQLLSMPYRVQDAHMPLVRIVDMKTHIARGKQRLSLVSSVLKASLEECMQQHHQAILFLNRRGYATSLFCFSCGTAVQCPDCSISLVYHQAKEMLVCHYCNYTIPIPGVCPSCGQPSLQQAGGGTQKLESEMKQLFPQARIARLDSDVTMQRGAHERILAQFKQHQFDILIGTQMVAKGHDFPNVTLVGILAVDMLLNFPDFRSSERTFNLISQAAGRAGRGQDKGKVIVQTYSPEHYAIATAAQHNYQAFYVQDTMFRQKLFYPPFSQIIKLTLRSRQEHKARQAAQEVYSVLESCKSDTFFLLGPCADDRIKVRGYYRWVIICKNREDAVGRKKLMHALSSSKKPFGVYLAIDVDPR